MAGIKNVPFRIPDAWSAAWFRQIFTEVIAKGDYLNGTYLSTSDVAMQVDTHNADPFAHPDVINAHKAESDPHPQYVAKSATTVADASGGATVDTEARAQLNALLSALRASGAIAT